MCNHPTGAGFGIARSARVGGSAREPDPPVGGGGGADPGFWGAIFLKNFPEKMAFFGDVCVEKIDFLGKLL